MSTDLNEDDIFGDVFSADDFGGTFGESNNTQSFEAGSSDGGQFEDGGASGNTIGNNADTEKARGKRAAIIILVASFIVLLMLGLGIRIANKEPKKTAKKQQTTVEQTKTSNGINSVYTQPSSSSSNTSSGTKGPLSDWLRVAGGDIALSKRIQGVLVVTDIQYLAKKTSAEDIKLEMDVRLLGYVPGIDGSYALHIPWRVADRISVGDRVNIYYYIGEIDGSRVVVDLSYSE